MVYKFEGKKPKGGRINVRNYTSIDTSLSGNQERRTLSRSQNTHPPSINSKGRRITSRSTLAFAKRLEEIAYRQVWHVESLSIRTVGKFGRSFA
jgi:hypothetical protein